MRLLSIPLLACLCLTLAACDRVDKGRGSGNEPAPPVPFASPASTESDERDPLVKSILSQNDAVKTMLAGRTEGGDYWLRIDYVDRWRTSLRGSNPFAMVNFYFDPPVSFSGEVPTESDPCQGHYDDDGYLINPDDPCTSQASAHSAMHRDFSRAGVIVMAVDLQLNEVVEVFESGSTPDELESVQSLYGTPRPLATPSSDDMRRASESGPRLYWLGRSFEGLTLTEFTPAAAAAPADLTYRRGDHYSDPAFVTLREYTLQAWTLDSGEHRCEGWGSLPIETGVAVSGLPATFCELPYSPLRVVSNAGGNQQETPTPSAPNDDCVLRDIVIHLTDAVVVMDAGGAECGTNPYRSRDEMLRIAALLQPFEAKQQ